jgi:hypothetical protein
MIVNESRGLDADGFAIINVKSSLSNIRRPAAGS